MGAALVGYMFVGPAVISEGAKLAAINTLREKQEIYQAILNIAESGAADWRDQFTDAQKKVLSDLDILDLEYCDTEDVQDKVAVRLRDPEQVVNEFIAFWREPEANDTAYQRFDGGTRQAVFAGAATWGETPEGDGFEHLRAAYESGAAEALGIEV